MSEAHPLPIVVDLLKSHGMDEAAERLLARCETCRWWGTDPDPYFGNPHRVAKDAQVCAMIVDPVRHGIDGPLAFLESWENTSCYTRANFYCAFWQSVCQACVQVRARQMLRCTTCAKAETPRVIDYRGNIEIHECPACGTGFVWNSRDDTRCSECLRLETAK